MIVTARTPEDYAVCCEFLKVRGFKPPNPDWRALAQLDDDKRMVALVTFDCFVRRTCCMHLDGFDGTDKRWLTKPFIEAVFHYLFVTANRVMVFGPVDARDERLLRMAKYLGFEELYRVPEGWDSEVDLVMLGMHKGQCRWLEA